ncbi:MAG: 2Fe-2S iron-sulfur cluster-binding protein [Gammaproteobacteria bacterium]
MQQKIRAGELQTFEGEILLADLLHAYPDARVEDTSMLERVEQIIEQATFINPERGAYKPDRLALTTRIMSLGRELSRHKRLLGAYRELTAELSGKIDQLSAAPDAPGQLKAWLEQAEAKIAEENATIDQSLINETFLRVMSAQATVIPSGHEFFVEGAESILEAGLRGGLALNYGCSNGNCGLCRIRVVSGEVRKIRHHDFALSEAEKGLGYVLGCCNTALSDVVLEADEASSTGDIPVQRIPVRIKKIDNPDGEVLIVSTRTPRTSRLRFLAGQGATLSIGDVGSGFYPIASCPCDDMNLQFHIARNPRDPLASYLGESARSNETVNLEGPVGSFVLNENSPNSLVFIAGGIGFASIKGLIEHAMALDVAEKIYLFWIAEDGTAHYLSNLCRAWNDAFDNFEYLPIEDSADGRLEKAIDAALDSQNPAAFDYYFCGGDGLRARIERFADARGIPNNQLLCQTSQPSGITE